jgi:hypothetical protein
MIPGRIQGATSQLTPPENWTAADGPCSGLAIREEVIGETAFMTSAWFPTPAELLLLQAGAPVILRISGRLASRGHPVVGLGVGMAPSDDR